jgi:hypothetical protein
MRIRSNRNFRKPLIGSPYVPPTDGTLPTGFQRWSSLATWGGAFPATGVDLPLGAGSKIYYDINMLDSSAPGKITLSIGAQMIIDPTLNTRLVADSLILDGGELYAGSSTVPYPMDFTLDLCGARPTISGNDNVSPLKFGITHDLTTDVSTGNNGLANDGYGMNRALIIQGVGKLKLFGRNAPMQRRLNGAVTAGVTTISVNAPVTARAGSIVLVTPDGFYNDLTRTEHRTLAVAAVNSTTLVLNAALAFARFGQLQYATDAGCSLTADAFTLRTVSNPTGMRARSDQNPLIDQRAFVVVIDPSMQIRGYDRAGGNTSLASYGYGMHCMQMDLTSEVNTQNIHTDAYGQLGLLGRYAFHVHMPSYTSATGANKTNGYLGTNAYPANWARYDGWSGVNGFNRFGDLHGVVGATITNCIGIDSQGHTFFMEDGPEQGNTISNCLAINPRDPGTTQRLKDHDRLTTGFWLSNPFNTTLENWCVDNKYGGPWWNAHSTGLLGVQSSPQYGCLGASSLVPIAPAFGKMGSWNGNSGLCCNGPATSDNGTTTNNGKPNGLVQKIVITTDGVAPASFGSGGGFPNWVTKGLLLQNMRIYKGNGYNNVVSSPLYLNSMHVDPVRLSRSGFDGITDQLGGAIDGLTVFRESLNHESHILASTPTWAFVPYHGTLAAVNISAYGFTGSLYSTTGGNQGALQKVSMSPTWDDYVQPVNIYSTLNSNWCTLNCDTIWQTPMAPLTEAVTTYDALTGTGVGSVKYQATGNRFFNIGIRYDHFGTEGVGPSTTARPGTHIVFNQPFFTNGLPDFAALAHNPQSGITTKPFVGIDFYRNNAYGENANYVTFQRCDSTGTDIAGAVLGPMNAYNRIGYNLLPFHHCAISVGSFVKVLWPNDLPPTAGIGGGYFVAYNDNYWVGTSPYLNVATDVTYWCIPWGAATSTVAISGQAYSQAGITSLASLVASALGFNYWQDVPNKVVWIRMRIHPSGKKWSIDP